MSKKKNMFICALSGFKLIPIFNFNLKFFHYHNFFFFNFIWSLKKNFIC